MVTGEDITTNDDSSGTFAVDMGNTCTFTGDSVSLVDLMRPYQITYHQLMSRLDELISTLGGEGIDDGDDDQLIK